MATIPNLNTIRTGRRGPRWRRPGRAIPENDDGYEQDEANVERARDQVVQQTDHDATSSRLSAITLGYLEDPLATLLSPIEKPAPRRYPIINRGTYVRTTAIDQIIIGFLKSHPDQRKQIVSLGAGSDTRFFRLISRKDTCPSQVEYHELDFDDNVNRKRNCIRSSDQLNNIIRSTEKNGSYYHLHAIDLRTLTNKSPPQIPNLDPDLPTLILSECCLCYLSPELALSVTQYFTMNLRSSLFLVLYEPIRPFDAFGKTMVSNLASRGIHLQTLKRYSTLEAQRQRLKLAGFTDGQGARDVLQIWQSEEWTLRSEAERIEKLEWLDEVEEWNLLASHYCIAWGWRGDLFTESFANLNGARTSAEDHDGYS